MTSHVLSNYNNLYHCITCCTKKVTTASDVVLANSDRRTVSVGYNLVHCYRNPNFSATNWTIRGHHEETSNLRKFRFSDAIHGCKWSVRENCKRKMFYVDKRTQGKVLYVKLCAFPYMTVEEARKEAHRVLAKISRDSNKKRGHVYAEAFFLDLFENYMGTNNWFLFLLTNKRGTRPETFLSTLLSPRKNNSNPF